MLIKKIPDTSGEVTTTTLNTKINEVENKIPDTSGLMTTNVPKLRINFLIMINILLLLNLIS